MNISESKSLGHISNVELGFTDRNELAITFFLTMKEYIWFDEDNKFRRDHKEGIELSETVTFTIWNLADPELNKKLKKLMIKAKVKDFNELKGSPVEVTMKDGMLQSWRILEEVL